MATPGDRVTEKATGRTGVVAAYGVNDAIAVGHTPAIWDDRPHEKVLVHDSTLIYETFVLVRQGTGRTPLYAVLDGTETTELTKAAKLDSRETAQRFKNEKNQFSMHTLRLFRECQ
jgi:hypothetical protein